MIGHFRSSGNLAWSVLVLCGKVLVAGGVTGVTSVRSCWKLPLCMTEPMPDGSKMDPPPAKSESISDSGSTSVITYLRRKKSCWTEMAARERSENV